MMTRRLAALAAAAAFLALAATAAAQPTLVAKWGSQGSGDGQFNVPWDLAVGRDGGVYVADSQNNRTQRFSSTGDFLGKWGASGTNPGQFQFPRAVAADAAGNVYVGDEGSHRIQKFGLDGSFQTQWGGGGSGAGQFSNPIAIAVDGAGNVYVGEFSGHRIQKFDSNGSFQRMWGWDVDAAQPGTGFEICTTAPNCKAGVYGSGPGQFGRPVGLAVDSAGNLYEADRDNDRVQKFSSNGDFLGTWGSAGSGDGQFEGPEDVAVDPAGNVSVADDTNYRIQKFTPSGGYLSQFNTVAPGETFRPASVIFDPQGDIYILGGLPSGVTILRAREGAAQPPPPGPTSPIPRPELGVSVVTEAVRGQVFVSAASGAARASQAQTVPGLKGRRFVPLREAREIPVGSFLDTRRGSVRLVSVRDRAGNTQTGDFAAGVFQGSSRAGRAPGASPSCRSRARDSAAAGRGIRWRAWRATASRAGLSAACARMRAAAFAPGGATPRPRSGARPGTRSTAATARSPACGAGGWWCGTCAAGATSRCGRAGATWPGPGGSDQACGQRASSAPAACLPRRDRRGARRRAAPGQRRRQQRLRSDRGGRGSARPDPSAARRGDRDPAAHRLSRSDARAVRLVPRRAHPLLGRLRPDPAGQGGDPRSQREVLAAGGRPGRHAAPQRGGRRGNPPARPLELARGVEGDRPLRAPPSRRAAVLSRPRRPSLPGDPDRPGSQGQRTLLECRHRQRARVEDHIRAHKDTGLRNLPFRDFDLNAVLLELVLAAHDLIAWAQALLLSGELAKAEPKRLRYRLLHVAARLAFSGRRSKLRLAANWPWATDLAAAFARLKALPQPAG